MPRKLKCLDLRRLVLYFLIEIWKIDVFKTSSEAMTVRPDVKTTFKILLLITQSLTH